MPCPRRPVAASSRRPRAVIAASLAGLLAACGGDGADAAADGAPIVGEGDAASDADAAPAGPPPMCEIEIVCGAEIPEWPKIDCTMRIEDGLGALVHEGTIGIDRRGRSSYWFAKGQYAVELRDQAGVELPVDLLGMGREEDWVLNGMYIDRGLLRNKLVYDMFQSLGGAERYAPESRYCALTLDGDWLGVYALAERIKRDDDRVVLAEDDGAGSSFILKQDDRDGFRSIGVANGVWQLVYPRQERATEPQVAGVATWLQGLEDAVAGAPGAADLFDLVDLESAVDFVLFEEFVKNVDAFYLSMHVAKDAGGKLRWIPWDVDLSFGQPLYGGGDVATGWIQSRPALIQAMADDPRFAARLLARWGELRAELITTDGIEARIADQMTTIAEALEPNFVRWPFEQIQFLDDQLPPRASHADELATIGTWIDARLAWMDANLAAYAAGNP